jgi:hypothetical protein
MWAHAVADASQERAEVEGDERDEGLLVWQVELVIGYRRGTEAGDGESKLDGRGEAGNVTFSRCG